MLRKSYLLLAASAMIRLSDALWIESIPVSRAIAGLASYVYVCPVARTCVSPSRFPSVSATGSV